MCSVISFRAAKRSRFLSLKRFASPPSALMRLSCMENILSWEESIIMNQETRIKIQISKTLSDRIRMHDGAQAENSSQSENDYRQKKQLPGPAHFAGFIDGQRINRRYRPSAGIHPT